MPRKFMQFSIAGLLVLTAFVAIMLRPDGKSWTDVTYMATNDATNSLVVATGVRKGKLVFIAITGDSKIGGKHTPSIVTGGAEQKHNWQTLNYPDGKVEPLPKDGYQLFQFIDGNWTESKGDVTLDEFQTFVASNPEQFTINALREFVTQGRRNAR